MNALIEPKGQDAPDLISRPGNSDLGSIRSGTAQGAYYFNGQVITVHGNSADRSTTGPLATTSIGTLGPVAVTQIARSLSVATVTCATNHGFYVGQSITISGADQAAYNGTFVINLIVNVWTFTYTVAGTPTSPATGTITVTPTVINPGDWYFADNGLTSGSTGYLLIQGPYSTRVLRSDWTLLEPASAASVATMPFAAGAVFLDGYFFVMDCVGNIWNSDLNADPSSTFGNTAWQGTSVLKASKESGAGIYLARSLNYIVALKEFSTEVFYDAGNPAPGSPLSPVDNAFSLNGCASAGSVATVDGKLMWIAQSRQRGRSISLMQAGQQQRVSTPDIDRILDADDLATVHAYGLKFGGHVLYVLTLVTSNITLVYDLTAQMWMQWSSLTVGSNVSVSTITVSGTTATVTTATAHGVNDGDPVKISGADQSAYNAIFQASYVSPTVFTVPIAAGTANATGTVVCNPYTESYFKFSKYVDGGGKDLLLHESDGHIYQVLPSLHQDAGSPINVFGRTIRLDGGDLDWKRLPGMELVGDTVSDFVMVRFSNDDGATHSAYRTVDLSLEKPVLRRLGAFRRRTIETRYVGNNYLRLSGFELELP